MSTAPSLSSAPFYWTWRRFVRGLQDWIRESVQPSDKKTPGKSKGRPKRSILGATVTVVALLALVSAFVAVSAPPTAEALGRYAVTLLSVFSTILMGGMLIFVLGALPYYAAHRGRRFALAMAYRGWELETGKRVPIGVVL